MTRRGIVDPKRPRIRVELGLSDEFLGIEEEVHVCTNLDFAWPWEEVRSVLWRIRTRTWLHFDARKGDDCIWFKTTETARSELSYSWLRTNGNGFRVKVMEFCDKFPFWVCNRGIAIVSPIWVIWSANNLKLLLVIWTNKFNTVVICCDGMFTVSWLLWSICCLKVIKVSFEIHIDNV